MSPRGAAAAFAGALALATASGACDPSEHVIVGQRYDPTLKCLGPRVTLDIADGADATCAPSCIFAPDDDGGGGTYVTSSCGPFVKPLAIVGGADCADALAAPACPDGGGAPPIDAAAE